VKLSNWRQFKVRSDLVVSTQTHQGRLYYVVKDPITLRYFRLRPSEYAIFKMLDGETSTEEIKERMRELGREIGDEELAAFLRQLGGANFFENVLPNQSESLYQAAVLRRRRTSLWAQAKRILFIKIPLYDPDRLFDRVLPWIRFLWSRWALAAYGVLFAAALAVFIANFGKASESFSELFTAKNLVIFWLIFIVVKTAHELGHGFTCKYFGGEVHELGILVLVLTPCLYCNISDAWIQERHSRKFYISAAGIITELIIASVAALVWWASAPGPAKAISYRIMILAGITSIIFNGNPLMKFDGYYILSDILGMPNLRSSSVHYVGQFFRKYVLGLPAPAAGGFGRTEAIKLFYGVASSVWIFYVMYRITRSLIHWIPPLGVWVMVSAVYGLLLIPLVRMAAFLARRRHGIRDVNLSRIAVMAAVVAGGAYFLFFHDIGYSVSARCSIMPAERKVVHTATGGVLSLLEATEGKRIEKGETLAVLENDDLRLELEELNRQAEGLALQADLAHSRGNYSLRSHYERRIEDLEERIARTRGRLGELRVGSPISGVVTTPSTHSRVGSFVAEGRPLVEIADLSKARVKVAVSEKDVGYVSVGAPARVTLRAYPWRTFTGEVSQVSKAPIRLMSPSRRDQARRGTQAARRLPPESTYEATIVLGNEEDLLKPNMTGQAEIAYGDRRLWDIIYTRARQNLRRSFGI